MTGALELVRAEGGSVRHMAEQLEELVRELYEFEPMGLVADFVNAALDRVDWAEIIEE